VANFSVYLGPDLYKSLAEHAEKHKVSKNSIVRDAVREMVMDGDSSNSMHEGQTAFTSRNSIEDFSQFEDCKSLKEAFAKAGRNSD
jgi:metal-responsive CopG/Arc/MetJ family transcriptional regulator